MQWLDSACLLSLYVHYSIFGSFANCSHERFNNVRLWTIRFHRDIIGSSKHFTNVPKDILITCYFRFSPVCCQLKNKEFVIVKKSFWSTDWWNLKEILFSFVWKIWSYTYPISYCMAGQSHVSCKKHSAKWLSAVWHWS